MNNTPKTQSETLQLDSTEIVQMKTAVSGYAAVVANRIVRGDNPQTKAVSDERRLTAAKRIADAIVRRPYTDRAAIAFEIESTLRREWETDYVPEQSLRTQLPKDSPSAARIFDNSFQRMLMLVGVLLSEPRKEAKPDTAATREAVQQVFADGEGI